jgi:hypothetical protein
VYRRVLLMSIREGNILRPRASASIPRFNARMPATRSIGPAPAERCGECKAVNQTEEGRDPGLFAGPNRAPCMRCRNRDRRRN